MGEKFTQSGLKQHFNDDFTDLANVSKQLKPCAKKQMAGDDSAKKKTQKALVLVNT